jgi:hypothetical protein
MLAKLGFADVGTPTPAVKHDALVSLGKHLGMFVDRHILEGSIEDRVALMTCEEQLVGAGELIEHEPDTPSCGVGLRTKGKAGTSRQVSAMGEQPPTAGL